MYPLDTLKTRLQSPDYARVYTHAATGKPNSALFRGVYQGLGSVIVATLPACKSDFIVLAVVTCLDLRFAVVLAFRIPLAILAGLPRKTRTSTRTKTKDKGQGTRNTRESELTTGMIGK